MFNRKERASYRQPTTPTTPAGDKGKGSPLAEDESPSPDDVREWREGRDLVVEVPGSPDEERRVKVFKDVFPEAEGVAAMKEARDVVRDDVDAFIKSVREEAKEAAHVLEHPAQAHSSTEGTSAEPQATTRGEEEWNDEPETPGPSQGQGVTIEEPVKPTRHPKKERRHSVGGHSRFGSGRRRDAVRRVLFDVVRRSRGEHQDEHAISDEASSTSNASSAAHSDNEEVPGRGRAADASANVVQTASRRSSAGPVAGTGASTPSASVSRIRFAEPGEPSSPIVRSPSGLINTARQLPSTEEGSRAE